jgi:hypothetical protein
MRLTVALITALILGLFSCPAAFAKDKGEGNAQKPELVTSVEKIAKGRTFQDQNSENVSFTLSPMKALFKISF